jgi:deoxyribodipyrimidine photolyase
MDALLRHLPDHLAERTRAVGSSAPAAGQMVLYWLRQGQRGHENPALDAAAELAAALGCPLYVHQSLSPAYPYASDRLCRFVLEGASDLHAELSARGIASALHLERRSITAEFDVVTTLASRAACVVLEDVPVEPWRSDARRLAAATKAPVLLVDSACVLPMRLAPRRPERAFRFRQATEGARAERLALPWPERSAPTPSALPKALPFDPLDLTAPPGELVAAMVIDHGIGPVADTPGGSRAGYARWVRFRDAALRNYARRRNDALDGDGVSRMSAYLHHGQVSPFTLAREAVAIGGPGAAKWLDEFLVWRELAHAWCCGAPDHETLAALPAWC